MYIDARAAIRNDERLDMTQQFAGKVVLITGGGGGIGKAAARRFLEEGARVVLSRTRQAVLDAAPGDLDPTGAPPPTVARSITTREGAPDLLPPPGARFGGLRVPVN